MRVRIANICSNFLDVQEASRRVSQQCGVRYHFARRTFKNGRLASIKFVRLCTITPCGSAARPGANPSVFKNVTAGQYET